MLPSGRPEAALRTVVWVSVSLAWAVMMIAGGWWASSLVAAENRQQFVQSSLDTPAIADVAFATG